MKTNFLSAAAIAALVFASCSNDKNTSNPNEGLVRFTSDISSTATRVGGDDGNQWAAGDAIGIYMIEHGQALSATSIREGADNVNYVAGNLTNNGLNADFTSTTPIYYPVSGLSVDFLAYHPYSASAIDGFYRYTMDVSNQSNQSAIDLMTAFADNSTAGYDKTNTSAVNLNFMHRLAKVVLNVTAGDGVADLTGLTIGLTGAHNIATFNLPDFTLVMTSASQNPQPIVPYYDAANNRYELILPQTGGYALSDCVVAFTVGGNTHQWTMSENTGGITALASGMKYTFDVSVERNGVSVSGTITPWNNVNGGGGTAD